MNRNILTAVLSILASRGVIIFSLMLTTPLLIRFLGESQYGQYATLMATFSLLMILTSAGINSGSRKYLAEERDRDNWQDHVFGFYFKLAVVLAFVAVAGFWLAVRTGVVAALYGPAMEQYFLLLAVLALFSQIGNYVRRALMGLKLEHLSEPINVGFALTFTVLAVTVTYLGFGVAGALAARIAAFVVVIGASLYFLGNRLSLSAAVSRQPEDFPRWTLFSFNYQTVVYVFLLNSLYHVDIMMLGATVANADVAHYKAALVLAEFLWLAPRAVQSVMIQSTSNLWNEGRTDRITELSSRITRLVLLFTTLLAVGIAALAWDFVPFYYPQEYVASIGPLLVLLPGAVGFAVARPILSISHAKGDMRVVIGATAAAAGINLALNSLLIPRMGITGAAIATSVGYGSLPVFHVLGARQLGFQPFSDARLPRVAATCLTAAVPIFLLARAIEGTFLSLVVVPPVGFLLYAAASLLTGAVTVEEIFDILGMLPDPLSAKADAVQQKLTG